MNNLLITNIPRLLQSVFKWRNELKRIRTIEDCGNVFLFEKLKKILQVWRLKTAELNVITSEPIRIKAKVFGGFNDYYVINGRKVIPWIVNYSITTPIEAVQLENLYFQRWESTFQVLQVGEHCCLQVLKLWDAQKRKIYSVDGKSKPPA